jgi:hypothetical protein
VMPVHLNSLVCVLYIWSFLNFVDGTYTWTDTGQFRYHFIVKFQTYAFKEICYIIIIIIYLTANGLSPGGSGYDTCT